MTMTIRTTRTTTLPAHQITTRHLKALIQDTHPNDTVTITTHDGDTRSPSTVTIAVTTTESGDPADLAAADLAQARADTFVMRDDVTRVARGDVMRDNR